MNFLLRRKDLVPFPTPIRVIEPVILFGIRGFALHEGGLDQEQFTISHIETGTRVAGGETREEAIDRAHQRITGLAKQHNRSEHDEIHRALQTARMKITSFENKAQVHFPAQWEIGERT